MSREGDLLYKFCKLQGFGYLKSESAEESREVNSFILLLPKPNQIKENRAGLT